MNKKMIKRVLSAALALCMLVAVMPVSTAADADELGYAGESFTYNLHMYNSNWTVENAWSYPEIGITSGVTEQTALKDVRGITADYTDGWELYSFNSGYKNDYLQFQLSNNTQLRITLGGADYWAAFKMPLKQGKYSLTVNYWTSNKCGEADLYLIPAPAEAITDDTARQEYITECMKNDTYRVTTDNNSLNTYSSSITSAENASKTFEVEAKNEGTSDYLFVLKQKTAISGSNNYFLLKGIEFDGEVFGDKYAYVKENADSTYSVSFIGGLKSIAYEKAGFEVYNGSKLVTDVTTQSAYKKLSFSDGVTEDKTPAYYGAGENGYIFFATADKLEAGTYTIKPYVVKDNAKTYHNDLSLELD